MISEIKPTFNTFASRFYFFEKMNEESQLTNDGKQYYAFNLKLTFIYNDLTHSQINRKTNKYLPLSNFYISTIAT